MKTSVGLSMLYANIDMNFETLCENSFMFQAHSRPKTDHVILSENKDVTYLNTYCLSHF